MINFSMTNITTEEFKKTEATKKSGYRKAFIGYLKEQSQKPENKGKAFKIPLENPQNAGSISYLRKTLVEGGIAKGLGVETTDPTTKKAKVVTVQF